VADRRKQRKARRPTRLNTGLAGTLSQRVPTRWVKFLIALFLLPLVWVFSQTFFGAFAWVTLEQQFWMSEPFWFFALGAVLWLILFYTLPRPMWIYVFGHEWTHALCIWIMGGRVEKIEVRSTGGHVLADKVNTWIALSPYFVPIYSVIAMALFAVAGLFVDVAPYSRWLFGTVGFTWAFHFSFTCWMIPKGQSDLEYGGQFFSLVIIYLANLILLSALLVVGSSEITPQLFLAELFHNTADFCIGVERAILLLLNL